MWMRGKERRGGCGRQVRRRERRWKPGGEEAVMAEDSCGGGDLMGRRGGVGEEGRWRKPGGEVVK